MGIIASNFFYIIKNRIYSLYLLFFPSPHFLHKRLWLKEMGGKEAPQWWQWTRSSSHLHLFSSSSCVHFHAKKPPIFLFARLAKVGYTIIHHLLWWAQKNNKFLPCRFKSSSFSLASFIASSKIVKCKKERKWPERCWISCLASAKKTLL